MRQQISNIWWPRIHRDITLLAKSCPNCQEAGKSIKPLLKQQNFVKIPFPEEVNDEIAVDFAGPFKVARSSKKHLIVSIDSKTGWQDAKFLRAPTTRKELNSYKDTSQITESLSKLEQTQAQHSPVKNFKNFAKVL